MTKIDQLIWRKSSYSDSNGACVEVAHLPNGGRAVRHSLDPASPVIHYTEQEWVAFLQGVHAGEFD